MLAVRCCYELVCKLREVCIVTILSLLFAIGQYLSGFTHSPMDACGYFSEDGDQLSFKKSDDLPSSFDWRDKGVIGDIRDQKRVHIEYYNVYEGPRSEWATLSKILVCWIT